MVYNIRMLTTTEAASRLGVKPKTVAYYIKRGLLKAVKFGRDYQITPDELDRFERERRKPGYPKGKPRKKHESLT